MITPSFSDSSMGLWLSRSFRRSATDLIECLTDPMWPINLKGMRLLFGLSIIGLILFAISFCLFPLQSDDLFMYLAMAKKYFELGHFPTTDIFLVKELPWHMEHQWLSYFFFYGLYQAGGYLLISFGKVILLLIIMALPFLMLQKSTARFLTGGVAVILTCLAANFRFFERSEIFTNLFLVLVILICLKELRAPSRLKWILPSIFALWVNLHPGFPLGWIILGAAVLTSWVQLSRRDTLKLAICTVLCVLVCWLNPLGTDGVLYPLQFSQTYAAFLRQYYFEWYSPFHPLLRSSPHLPFLLMLEVFTFGLLIFNHRSKPSHKPWFQWIVFVVMSDLALTGIRFTPTFCFVMIALSLSLIPPEKILPRKSWALAVLAFLCFGIALKNVVWGYETISGPRQVGVGIDKRVVPFDAVEWMKAHHLQGPLYNSHMFGAYLAWAWDGKYMYDGSITNPEYFLNEYLPFSRSPADFDRLVAKYQIQNFLLDRFADSKSMLDILTHHPGWKLVFIDEGSLIFSRQP